MGRLPLWLLCCCLVPVVNSQTITTQDPPAVVYCNNITVDLLRLTNDPDVCQFNPTDPTLGASDHLVTFDFTRADPETLNQFLAKGFEKLIGAIVMDGNEHVEAINFAGIKEWSGAQVPKSKVFIQIRNNQKLKRFEWTAGISLAFSDAESTNLTIYNNPQLEEETINVMIKAMKNIKMAVDMQEGPGECRFQDPLNLHKYTPPKPNDLVNCHRIKGDLILEKVKITNNLELDKRNDACLRLIDVDMSDVEITAPVEKGTRLCENDEKSEIRNNKNFCYRELVKVEQYFKTDDRLSVDIHVDDSCAEPCSNQTYADNIYVVCNVTTTDVDITSWFDGDTDSKPRSLKKTHGTVTILGSRTAEISLPALTEAYNLKITDNPDLKKIELPALQTINDLTIVNNPLLTPAGLRNISKIVPNKAAVECYTDKTTVIWDFHDLDLCTVIKGNLVLRGLKQQVDERALAGKTIEGCVALEGTLLKEVEFLKNAVIKNCRGVHVFKDNPSLCPLLTLQNVTVEVEGTRKRRGCGKTCTALDEKNCGIFKGDLTIDEKTPAEELNDLEIIQGSLIIINTKLVNLTFPKLEIIESGQASALKIRNNPQLEWILMPVLRNISALDGGRPIVEIVDNIRLNDVEFLPKGLKNSCTDMRTAICYQRITEKGGYGISLYGWLIIVGLIAHLLIVGVVVCWKLYKPDRDDVEEMKTIHSTPREEQQLPAEEEEPTQKPRSPERRTPTGPSAAPSSRREMGPGTSPRPPKTTNTKSRETTTPKTGTLGTPDVKTANKRKAAPAKRKKKKQKIPK